MRQIISWEAYSSLNSQEILGHLWNFSSLQCSKYLITSSCFVTDESYHSILLYSCEIILVITCYINLDFLIGPFISEYVIKILHEFLSRLVHATYLCLVILFKEKPSNLYAR